VQISKCKVQIEVWRFDFCNLQFPDVGSEVLVVSSYLGIPGETPISTVMRSGDGLSKTAMRATRIGPLPIVLDCVPRGFMICLRQMT